MNFTNLQRTAYIKDILKKDTQFFEIANFQNITVFFKGSKYSKNLIQKLNPSDFEEICNTINFIDYGILILIYQHEIIILNDPHGAYPLFLYQNENKNILVDNLNLLEKNILTNYDFLGFVDFYLFHHTVGENTLHKNTKRLPGKSVVSIKESGNFEIRSNKFADHDKTTKTSDVDSLVNHIEVGTTNNKTVLTLTGGYDSRLLLSLLLGKNKSFETATWGIKGNLQTEVAKNLSEQFSLKHHEIQLGDEFLNNIPNYINKIFERTPDSPFILDMPQFIYFSDEMVKMHGNIDLITGFLGSELLRGPTYSSEVLLTKFVAELYRTTDINQLKKIIEEKLINSDLFNKEFVASNLDILTERYLPFSSVETGKFNNNGQAKYLLNEKYGKLFSQIIRVHNQSINLINPYLNASFVQNQINRNFSNKELYLNSKIQNFKSYKYYAELIKDTYPELLNTKIDKGGFLLKDLLTVKGYCKIFYRKFISNNKSKTKKKYNPPINYSVWLKNILQETLISRNDNLSYTFNNSNIKKIVEQKYDNLTLVEKNSLIVITGLYLFNDYLNNKKINNTNE